MNIYDKFKTLPEAKVFLTLAMFSFGITVYECCPLLVACMIYIIVLCMCIIQRRYLYTVFGIIFVLGGLCSYSSRIVSKSDISEIRPGNIISVQGEVSETEKKRNSYIFYLEAKAAKTDRGDVKTDGKIAVYSKVLSPVSEGDYICLSGYFGKPKEQTNPIKFDFADYLGRRNIHSVCYVKDIKDIQISRKNRCSIKRISKNYIQNIYKKYFLPKTGELLMGMVLGNANYLDRKTYENFANTSVLHLLAASGFNTFVLYGILVWLLFFCEFRIKNLIIIPILWFYAVLINMPASILRAAVMCSLFLFGESIKRRTSSKHILFLSAFIILLIDPSELFDVGFQLSYLCIFGLFYIFPVFVKPFTEINIYRKGLAMRFLQRYALSPFVLAFMTTLSVFVSVTPVCMYYFNYVSVFGIFANILVSVLASLIFVFAVLFLFVCYIPVLCPVFVWIIDFLGSLILNTVNFFGESPFAVITVSTLPKWIFVLYYFLLFVFAVYMNVIKTKGEEK